MSYLKKHYQETVVKALMASQGYKNKMQVPKLVKIVVNVGLGEGSHNAKVVDAGLSDLTKITGQKSLPRKAKKSVAGFKVREGMTIGAMVTLRGERMYDFLGKLIQVGTPRIRDFRGLNPKSFDGRGNYNLGLKDQLIFPEINYDEIDQTRGMNITIVTTADTDAEGLALLTELGLPFMKPKKEQPKKEEAVTA